MRLALALLPVLAATSAPGCTFSRVNAGRPIGSADAALVAPGTPEAAVLERLGPPDLVLLLPSGPAFEYAFATDTSRALDLSAFNGSFHYNEAHARRDRLLVAFDPRGRVAEVSVVRQTGALEAPPGDR
jgi:hypothetical protein